MSTNRLTKQIFGSACVGLLSLSMIRPAGAQWVNFDTSACKQEAGGKFYVALGKEVLAVPNGVPKSVATFVMRADPRERFSPPDASQPEGCPQNRLQVVFYSLPIHIELPATKAWPLLAATLRIWLYRTTHDHDSSTSRSGRQWDGESVSLLDAEVTCKDPTVKRFEGKVRGFSACLIPRQDSRTPEDDWGGVYIAKADVYRTPLDRSFIIRCDPGQVTIPSSSCEIDYIIHAGIGISYKIKPAMILLLSPWTELLI